MKFIRLITIATISITLFLGSVQALAEEEETTKEVRQITTDGQIIFTPGDRDDTIVDPGTDGPDVEIPPITGPDGENKGPLTIATVPTMNFGSQIISTTDEHYKMIAEKQQLKGTTGEENQVPYVSLAQVQDTRGSNEGWKLTVSLTEFKSTKDTQNSVLRGVKITLFDPELLYSIDDPEQKPEAHANGLELLPGEEAVPVMTAAAKKGAGTSSVVWGNHNAIAQQVAAGADKVENGAIQLFVPGTTAKDAVTYKSTLTWELNQTPDNSDPETDI
ncbi:WxL domain cell surface protein [Enterococcus casseliflavus]|uniref:WxL domain-containing protein n=1 Tax=Enterococcus casseliflavus TaxID=37734 RepID=UPI0008F0382F|nr:WxL domain-containing protein [Enterococcus casseliflavus]GEB30333.1 cell surface protein [Enterococcus casseliflavus]SFE55871.1 WxL domain surface cell wall-binding [Enterococcus casseliflavus]STP33445.1 WxL domain cell surface protein [Enterococcus casseliflavus]